MKMEKTEQHQIRAILVQAIANICRKGLTYHKNFSIEGLLGITLDDDEIFLLNIKETIHHSGYLIANSRNGKAALDSSPDTSSQNHSTSPRAKWKQNVISPPNISKDKISPKTVVCRGKRRSSGGGYASTVDETQPSFKKSASTKRTEIFPVVQSEDDSTGEDQFTITESTNGGLSNGQGVSMVIKPVKKRSLWGRSRRSKPRKSTPVRVVPTSGHSMPVFPEQDATDLGHFLSMKPMLRDIDDAGSNLSDEDNKDEDSNHSIASLRIDTSRDSSQAKDNVEAPQVYIDHCVDDEFSEALNLTSVDSEAEPGGLQRAHMIVNGNGDAYQCGVCEELFADQTTCRRHMQHQHKAKVSYSCELCGRRFWHYGDYTEHKAVFHEGPGGYPCLHCGKMLLSKRGLKEHTQHHTGEFPYFCTHCNRGFGRKFEYTGHMRKHHHDDLNMLDTTIDSSQDASL